MEILEKLRKDFKNVKNIITVSEIQSKKFPKLFVSNNVADAHPKFIASQIHPKKTRVANINNEDIFICECYVTFKRPVVMKKEKMRSFLIFTKEIFVSDEHEIIKYLTDNKISYKEDFDTKNNCKVYFFWEPVYVLINENSYEEISKKEHESLRHLFLKYKTKAKKLSLKKKIKDIESCDNN